MCVIPGTCSNEQIKKRTVTKLRRTPIHCNERFFAPQRAGMCVIPGTCSNEQIKKRTVTKLRRTPECQFDKQRQYMPFFSFSLSFFFFFFFFTRQYMSLFCGNQREGRHRKQQKASANECGLAGLDVISQTIA